MKLLNPLIWLINFLSYLSHLERYRGHPYKPYNFEKDIKYRD